MGKVETINERISQIRRVIFDGDNRKMAQLLDIHENSLSSICSGYRKVSKKLLDNLMVIAPKVNASWLYFGEGDMFKGETTQANINVNGTNNGTATQNIGAFDDKIMETLANQQKTIEQLTQIIDRLTKVLEAK